MTSGEEKKSSSLLSPPPASFCALPTGLFSVFQLPETCGAERTHNMHTDEEQEKRRGKGKSSSSCLCVMYHSLSVFPLLYTTACSDNTKWNNPSTRKLPPSLRNHSQGEVGMSRDVRVPSRTFSLSLARSLCLSVSLSLCLSLCLSVSLSLSLSL